RDEVRQKLSGQSSVELFEVMFSSIIKIITEQTNLYDHQQNAGMGGVDLFHQSINAYRIGIKSKKWYFVLFTAMVNMSIVNSWHLHQLLWAKNRLAAVYKRRHTTLFAKESVCFYTSTVSTIAISKPGLDLLISATTWRAATLSRI